MADERQDVLVEDAEQLREVPRAARRLGGKALAHRFERVGLEDGSVAQPVDPGDEHVDDGKPIARIVRVAAQADRNPFPTPRACRDFA